MRLGHLALSLLLVMVACNSQPEPTSEAAPGTAAPPTPSETPRFEKDVSPLPEPERSPLPQPGQSPISPLPAPPEPPQPPP